MAGAKKVSITPVLELYGKNVLFLRRFYVLSSDADRCYSYGSTTMAGANQVRSLSKLSLLQVWKQ